MRLFSKSPPKHSAASHTDAKNATKTTGVRFADMDTERKISNAGQATEGRKLSKAAREDQRPVASPLPNDSRKARETVARQVPKPLPKPPHRRRPADAQPHPQTLHFDAPQQVQQPQPADPVLAPADDWLDQLINAQSADDILKALREPTPDERPFENTARVRPQANRAPK